MKVLIDISQSLYNRVKDSIDAGEYESVSAFVVAAIENQLLLEKKEEEDPIQSDMLLHLPIDKFSREPMSKVMKPTAHERFVPLRARRK